MSNLMDIRPMGDELFHVDGQTDKTNLTVAFHNFANATIKDITTMDFFSKPTGMLAGGNKPDLTDKMRAL